MPEKRTRPLLLSSSSSSSSSSQEHPPLSFLRRVRSTELTWKRRVPPFKFRLRSNPSWLSSELLSSLDSIGGVVLSTCTEACAEIIMTDYDYFFFCSSFLLLLGYTPTGTRSCTCTCV